MNEYVIIIYNAIKKRCSVLLIYRQVAEQQCYIFVDVDIHESDLVTYLNQELNV